MQMNRMRTLLGIVLSALTLAASAQDLVITNARIIDGTDRVIANGSVVVRDGEIAQVTSGTANARGARVIDAQGMTVMPGFIDAHRHIIRGEPDAWMRDTAANNMREFLEAGFTTVLSAGDPLDQILALRSMTASGQITGPRILVSGRAPLAGPSGPGFEPGVDPARVDFSRPPHRPTEAAPAIPEEQTRALVRQHAQAGVDFIKTVIITTPGGPEQNTLSIIADEASRQGIASITHAVTVIDTLAAVRAGTHSLVHSPHIGMLTEAETQEIVDAGIPMTSTLAIFMPTFAEDNRNIRNRTGEDNIPRFRDLDPFPMDTISSGGQGPVNARLLYDAGITYGFGTDTTYHPLDSFRHEIRSLRLMFSRRDIVTIMTRNAAAAILRAEDYGTLERGKVADIVVLDGNPLADIDALYEVRVVIKGGEVVVDKR
jgi:imidazolonepropionase-like amidohydrolase